MKEGEDMIFKKFSKNDKGMTLLEVLLSITILSIIMLGMLSFFTQAYSYTKNNEDKTIAVNVAKNILVYIEKQSFSKINETYSIENLADNTFKLVTNDNCTDLHTSGENVFDDSCTNMFNATFNNVTYDIKVEFSKHSNVTFRDYLIPVKVTVSWDSNNTTTIEGFVTNESIR